MPKNRLAADAEIVNLFFEQKSGDILETESKIFSAWEDLSNAPSKESWCACLPA